MSLLIVPRFSAGDDVAGYLNSVARALEQWANTGAAGRQHYVVANGTTQRTLDVAGATGADIRNVVGTMIADLQQKGALP